MAAGLVSVNDGCLQTPSIWLQVAKHLKARVSCVELQSFCISSAR